MLPYVKNKIVGGTLTALAALACVLAAVFGASAADYPNRVITLVVPYPPGGGVDAMARVVAAKLSDVFKQQVIVDNKPGAGGTLGTRLVAHAPPDGYTLLLGHTGTVSIDPSLFAHAGYDPRKDFEAIGLVASMPVAFSLLPPALGNIQAGKLRAIAVTSKKRFSLLPEVPTFDESGMPGFESVLHYGLLAPAGTPKEIIDKLSVELRKLVETDDVKKRIHFEGGDPLTSTSAEYAADINKEEAKWSALVHKLNLKVE